VLVERPVTHATLSMYAEGNRSNLERKRKRKKEEKEDAAKEKRQAG
jgi:hypothetical protein